VFDVLHGTVCCCCGGGGGGNGCCWNGEGYGLVPDVAVTVAVDETGGLL